MTSQDEILEAMKGKGHSEPPVSTGAQADVFAVLTVNKGQWFTTTDFTNALKEAGVEIKNVGMKLASLEKKGLCEKTDGKPASFRVV